MNKIKSLCLFRKIKSCRAEVRFPSLLLLCFLLHSALLPAQPADELAVETDLIRQMLSHWQQQSGWQQLSYTLTPWMAGGAEHLPECLQPVHHELAKRASQPWGRYQFRFTCDEPNWTFRARVDVSATLPVWTLTQGLKKGQAVTAAHLQLMPVALDKVQGQITTAEKDWLGYRAKHSLSAGQVLQEKDLLAPLLIHKGDTVVMRVEAEGMFATTKGEAMADGILGAQIDVRNLSSQKVVQGLVTNSGEVTIRY